MSPPDNDHVYTDSETVTKTIHVGLKTRAWRQRTYNSNRFFLKYRLQGQQDGSQNEGTCTKPENLSLIPRTHMVGKENQLLKVVLWPLYVDHGMHAPRPNPVPPK
jgi:hypothetical protein